MTDSTKAIIYIIDDDESVRRALKRLIRSANLDVEVFGSAQEFLNSSYRRQNVCLIVDIQMPGVNGLEMQRKLLAAGNDMPVIFVTAFDSKETRDEARKLGAASYFRKPVDDQALLDTIEWALGSAGA